MTNIVEAFDKLFSEKQVPVQKTSLEEGLTLYQVQYKLSETHDLALEVIVEKPEPVSEVQIAYRFVGQLTDYARKADMLELVNSLNEMRTGYYTLYLAGDGELYLRALLRCGQDIQPAYETIYHGSHIARLLVPDIEAITGPYTNVKTSI